MQTSAASSPTLSGATRRVIASRGAAGLWRGLGVNMLNALPTVGFYLVCYDTIKAQWHERQPEALGLAPLVAGIGARTLAVVASSPLEALKTRQMASAGSRVASVVSPRLFEGFLPYLLRDVPFSAVYWSVLEPFRKMSAGSMFGRRPRELYTPAELIGLNLMAGCFAGTVATVVTMPMDNVYVRAITAKRTGGGDGTMSGEVRKLWSEAGAGGFFRGVVPRVTKIAPSCAIVIASYEMLKRIVMTSEHNVP